MVVGRRGGDERRMGREEKKRESRSPKVQEVSKKRGENLERRGGLGRKNEVSERWWWRKKSRE